MMKSCARMVEFVGMATVLCIVLFSFAGTWFGRQGSVLQFAREMVNQRRCAEALQYRLEVVRDALERKERIVSELIEGRLCLREAIVQTQKVNQQLREDLAVEGRDQELIAPYVPVSNDPESVGRQLLNWVRVDVALESSDKRERLLADFEREFQKLFGTASQPDASMNLEWMRRDVGCDGRGSPKS